MHTISCYRNQTSDPPIQSLYRTLPDLGMNLHAIASDKGWPALCSCRTNWRMYGWIEVLDWWNNGISVELKPWPYWSMKTNFVCWNSTVSGFETHADTVLYYSTIVWYWNEDHKIMQCSFWGFRNYKNKTLFSFDNSEERILPDFYSHSMRREAFCDNLWENQWG